MAERSFSTYQVAELLGSSTAEVAGWMEKGWLEFRRLPGGPVRIAESSLVKFLKARGVDIDALMAQVAPGQSARELAQHYPSPARAAAMPLRGRDLDQDEGEPDRISLWGSDEADAAPDVEDEPQAPSPAAADSAPPAAARGAVAVEAAATREPSVREAPAAPPPAKPAAMPPHAAAPAAPPAVRPPAAIEEPADPAAQVARAILADAVAREADALHLEPRADGLALRFRVDGVMYDKANFRLRLPPKLAPRLIERLAAMAGLDGKTPGQGRFALPCDGRQVACRLSMAPMLHGWRVAVTLGDGRRCAPALTELGLAREALRSVRRLLGRRSGLVLLAGPQRAGLERFANALAREAAAGGERNVIWIGRSGVALEPVLGQATYFDAPSAAMPDRAAAVALLEGQDADAVFIDGVCEPATLAAAGELARSALVVAVDSAESAADAIARASGIAAGQFPLPVAGAIGCWMMRRLCPECRRQGPPPADALERLELTAADFGPQVWHPVGCGRCDNTGYAGRLVVLEGLDGALPPAPGASAASGLRIAAMPAIAAGQTSVQELARLLA
jgi:general secretion pathway protein E